MIGSQNFYYLVKIADNGVGEMKWICFTENEDEQKRDTSFLQASDFDESDKNLEIEF